MQRVHTVTPEALLCRDTVVTGSSSGQPQNGQHCITASSLQGFGFRSRNERRPKTAPGGIRALFSRSIRG